MKNIERKPLTVQELIDLLESVENKNAFVELEVAKHLNSPLKSFKTINSGLVSLAFLPEDKEYPDDIVNLVAFNDGDNNETPSFA